MMGLLMVSTINLSSQPLGFSFKENRRKVEIPFEMYNNLIVVPITLNRIIPLKFILDTGIRTSILTEKIFGDMLNVPYTRKISIKGPGSELVVEASVANNVTVELPGLIGRGQALLVLEEDYLQLDSYLGTEVQGILGYEIFSRFVVEIDYRSKMLVVYKPDRYKVRRRYTRVPIEIIDTKPYLRATVKIDEGHCADAKLMIDTGASHALMLEDRDDDNIFLPDKRLKTTLGRGLGGEITGHLARVDEVALDEFQFNEVIASYPELSTYLDTLDLEREGTIGGELLNRFRVVFDYGNNYLYLKKNSDYKKEFEFNMSGIEVNAFGENLKTFKVISVRENSPASEVGIKVGDVITKLNGIASDNLTLNYIHSLFTVRENRKIRMFIKREDEKMKKVFRLRRLI